MRRNGKKIGNILFVTILSSLVLTVSLSFSAIASYSLFRAREEISSNQMRLTAKSALSQILCRIDKKIYNFSNNCDLDRVLENSNSEKLYLVDWESIVLESDNRKFSFPKSFLEADESFPNSLGKAEINIYFDGDLKGRSVNNLNSDSIQKMNSRYNIPPYSLDLMINIKYKNRVKRFEAIIAKSWPFALCSIESPVAIEGPATINGDICSFYKPKKTSNDFNSTASVIINNNYGKSSMPSIHGDIYTSDTLSSRRIIQGQTNGECFGGIEPFFSPDILSSFLSLSTDIEGRGCFSLNETLIEKELFETNSEIIESAISKVNEKFSGYMPPIAFVPPQTEAEEQCDEFQVFMLREDLVLEGNNLSESYGNVTASGHSNYIIKGSLISSAPEEKEKEDKVKFAYAYKDEDGPILGELPGIKLSNCTLTIDGDLILTGASFENSWGKIKKNLVPRIEGRDSALIVTGDIYMMSAEIESKGEQFVIYSDGSIWLQALKTSLDPKFKSEFRGAVVCKGCLSISTLRAAGSIYAPIPDELVKVSGAMVAGGGILVGDAMSDNGMGPMNNVYSKCGMVVKYITVDYNPQTIGLLHKLIGYPRLSVWREYNQ